MVQLASPQQQQAKETGLLDIKVAWVCDVPCHEGPYTRMFMARCAETIFQGLDLTSKSIVCDGMPTRSMLYNYHVRQSCAKADAAL